MGPIFFGCMGWRGVPVLPDVYPISCVFNAVRAPKVLFLLPLVAVSLYSVGVAMYRNA